MVDVSRSTLQLGLSNVTKIEYAYDVENSLIEHAEHFHATRQDQIVMAITLLPACDWAVDNFNRVTINFAACDACLCDH